MSITKTIRLNKKDNVVVSRENLDSGTFIQEEQIMTVEFIPKGFKIATCPILKGEPIVKYNTVMGYASEDIRPGQLLHDQNIAFDEVKN